MYRFVTSLTNFETDIKKRDPVISADALLKWIEVLFQEFCKRFVNQNLYQSAAGCEFDKRCGAILMLSSHPARVR